ncbi:MAG TPA: sodium:solute symporter [Clostridiales bacterium]|jgi:SSS family solute:Na+ symporter|nr:sodium:solute symporter [Clostridiales bacterium]
MFAVFAGILLYGGYVTRKWINDSDDYLLAGREVSLVINVFGVAAIGFAGTSIVLCPGFTVLFGLKGGLTFGVAYLIAGLMMYGIIFAKFIRRCGAQTLPEWLEMRFDSRTRTVVTITTVLGLLGILANNVVSMAITVSGFTEWNYLVTTSIVYALFLIFTYAGGFWAVTLTDFMQMMIGLIALPTLLFSLMAKFGGLGASIANWPGPGGLLNTGISGASMPGLALKYPSVLTMFLLFAMFLVWGNNYYWLRVATCRSERVARKSYIYASLLLMFLSYSILYMIGIYAGTNMTDVFTGGVAPTAAFGVTLRVVPVGVASFALLGALASSISTATTAHMGATGTTVRDIYARLFRPNATPKELMKPSKIIMLVLGILVWFLSFYPGGPTYLFAFATAWLGPPAVLVFYGAFWPRITKDGAFWGAIISIGAMMIVTILELTGVWAISQYMHQGVFGLIITLVLTTGISLATKPNYYGESSWTVEPQGEIPDSEVNDMEKEILDLIRKGYDTMGEITDYLGVDSSKSNNAIEELDQKRYITRFSNKGSDFYKFKLTEAGRNKLPKLTEGEEKLAEQNLIVQEIELLGIIEDGEEAIRNYVKEKELSSLKFSVMVSKLIKYDYLSESGLLKRKIHLTDEGKKAINMGEELLA